VTIRPRRNPHGDASAFAGAVAAASVVFDLHPILKLQAAGEGHDIAGFHVVGFDQHFVIALNPGPHRVLDCLLVIDREDGIFSGFFGEKRIARDDQAACGVARHLAGDITVEHQPRIWRKRHQHINQPRGRIDTLADDVNLAFDLIACAFQPPQLHRLINLKIRCLTRLDTELHLDAILRCDFHQR
jgi:hypothetical protein